MPGGHPVMLMAVPPGEVGEIGVPSGVGADGTPAQAEFWVPARPGYAMMLAARIGVPVEIERPVGVGAARPVMEPSPPPPRLAVVLAVAALAEPPPPVVHAWPVMEPLAAVLAAVATLAYPVPTLAAEAEPPLPVPPCCRTQPAVAPPLAAVLSAVMAAVRGGGR